MIKLNNFDFDITIVAPNPLFGYVDEYKEYSVISGKIRREYAGKRFRGEIPCGYFTNEQIAHINALQDTQKIDGHLAAQVDMPGNQIFVGDVFLSVNNLQARFAKINDAYVWTNWNIVLTGADLV